MSEQQSAFLSNYYCKIEIKVIPKLIFLAPYDVINQINLAMLCFFVRFVISVKFRSLVPNGVLLYATNDLQNPTHFISLELVNGRLVFKYNAGYKTVKIMSTLRSYADDGQEYTVNTHSFLCLPVTATTGNWGNTLSLRRGMLSSGSVAPE